MKKLILSAIVTTLISTTVFGGALNSKVVGGDATWVAHIDIESILNSDLGKMFLAAAEEKEGFAQGIEDMKKHLGCDPLKDIRGITVYGPVLGDHDGAVVVDVTVATDKLIDILKAKESYESSKHGEHVIHQWTDDKKHSDKKQTTYACFYDNKTVAFGSSVKRLASALDVLDGKADSLAKTNAIKALPDAVDGSFFVVAADKIVFPEGKAPRAAILKRITALSIQGGEGKDGVFISTSVLAGSDKDAVNMRKFIQGFLALSEMIRQQEKFADLQDLGEKIEIGGEGKEVRIDASIPVKSIVRILTFIDKHRKDFGARKRSPRRDDAE
ncbi:MAG: hypothetical protein QGG42_18790 [Phycisphaerae bacterium]|jgi:hypothetical protein|nr:hypothetical protein [Phycisphaerae bacterium]